MWNFEFLFVCALSFVEYRGLMILIGKQQPSDDNNVEKKYKYKNSSDSCYLREIYVFTMEIKESQESKECMSCIVSELNELICRHMHRGHRENDRA